MDSFRLNMMLATTGMAAIAMPGAALAQAQVQSAPQADKASEGVGDIIVTAQRREESLQKSPLSIQVLSKDDIIRAGTASPRDLNTMVPGLAVSQGASYTQTFIRGVGDITSNAFGSNGVMYSIDGVVIDRALAISPNFFDLERIEVLKGPQGTLYGRNSTGGAINLLTRRPDGRLGGYTTIEAGNYNLLSGSVALNVPLSDTLKVRSAFQAVKHDGYLTDGRDDNDRRSGRLSVLFEPSSDFSLLVVGDLAHLGGRGPGGVVRPLPAGAGTPWTGPSDPLVTAQLLATVPIALVPNGVAFLDQDFANISAEANATLGFTKLTVVGGYRHINSRSRTAQAGFDNQTLERADQYSIEARLAGDSDRFKWVVGGFYFDEKQFQDTEALLSNIVPFGHSRTLVPRLPTRSTGAFGQATWSVTPSLRLTGGLRYTHEHKEVEATVSSLGFAPVPAANISGSQSFNKITWKAGVEYDVAPEHMLYATLSTGFKAGGFSPVVAPNTQYKPETLTSFSAGSRNRFLNNHLQLNAEGFYWKYKNYQATALAPQSNGFTGVMTLNAGEATIYGLDVELVAKLSRNDTIRFVGEYLHTKFDSFIYDRSATGLVPGVSIGCPVGPVHTSTTGGPVQAVDCSGFELQRSPKLSGSASYQHVFPLANGGDLDFKGTVGFAASRWIAIEYVPLERASAYATVDADLTYHAPDDRFSVSVFVRNLANKDYYTGGVLHPFSGGKLLYQTIGAPRTYGARLNVNF